MVEFSKVARQYLSNSLFLSSFFLLTGCVLAQDSAATNTPSVFPFEGAPVTVTLDDETLIVSNKTPDAIYYLAFPSEILPAIEWAPCLAPEVCPADQRLDPAEVKRINLRGVATEGTEEIIVFWWRFLEKVSGASVPPMVMEEIAVPLP